MSSRSGLPTEVYSTDSRLSQSDSLWGAVGKSKSNLSIRQEEEPGRRLISIQLKRVSSLFEVANYVCLHSSRLVSMYPAVLSENVGEGTSCTAGKASLTEHTLVED